MFNTYDYCNLLASRYCIGITLISSLRCVKAGIKIKVKLNVLDMMLYWLHSATGVPRGSQLTNLFFISINL